MRKAAVAALALTTLGIVLSLLLERQHVLAHVSPSHGSFCSLTTRLDCTAVALSRWSVLLGVPVPLWGALGFFAIGAAVVRESRWLLPLTAAGAVASLALLAVEIVSIGALCILCEAVHLVSFALFGLALVLRREFRAPLAEHATLLAVFAAPGIAFVALAAFLPHYWGAFGWNEEPPFAQGKTAAGHPWIGATAPEVTVEEFTDYRCPHCRAAAVRNLRRLSEHPKSFRIVRRQFPRGRCPKRPSVACLSLRMAYCAEEQGKFWQADRWLFEHGGARKKSMAPAMASDLELDSAKFDACLARSEPALRAAEEANAAIALDLDATPAYFIGGERVTERDIDGLLAGLP